MALLLEMPLNDDAASTTVGATVGSNGTLVGGDNTSAKHSTGPGGSITASLSLNGTDDGIDVAWSDSNVISVSIWVLLGAAGNYPMFVCRSQSGGNGSAGIELRGFGTTGRPELLVDTTNGDRQTATSSTAINGTGWHHLLGVYNGTNIRLWDNGTLVATTAATGDIQWGTAVARIGARRFTNQLYANAAFAMLRIYDSDESANVATLYAEGVSGGSPSSPPFSSHLLHSPLIGGRLVA